MSQSKHTVSADVLITLFHTSDAGGHVKFWEHLADAANNVDELDLNLYLLGDQHQTSQINQHARLTTFRPVLDTGFISPLINTRRTDLTPFHPSLAKALRPEAVWHATDQFAFSLTASLVARRRGHPLVASHHSDVEKFIGIYTRKMLKGKMGSKTREKFFLNMLQLDRGFQSLFRIQTKTVWRNCQAIVASNEENAARAESAIGDHKSVSHLRHGIDHANWSPELRDRQWLQHQYGIAPKCPVIAFAGRLDATKSVLLLTKAVKKLTEADEEQDVHLLAAGSGPAAKSMKRILGPQLTLTGTVPQPQLAKLFASSDLFAFPSTTETAGCVVAEAMACGLPVVLASDTATNQWLHNPGRDGQLVKEQTPEAWAAVLRKILKCPEQRRALGEAALQTSQNHHPSWETVLCEDLMPVWKRAAP
jgi:glycosyltransferase involved in cell wall biosynthesis